jgi:hypothetical protein
MIYILIFFLSSYLMVATSYTFEAVINKDTINEHPYLVAPAFFWCLLICWFYFPFDLGQKLFKKLS